MGGAPSGLDPELASAADSLAGVVAEAGGILRFTSGRRSHSEQARLYRRSLQGLSPYPAAPPGSSAHEYGWAFDAVVEPRSWQSDVGAVWMQAGGSWGGRGDPVHFELPGASAAAKRMVQVPGSEAAKVFAGALDIAIGFIPAVGAVETGATILRLFPGFKESEILDFLQGPNSYLLQNPDLLFSILSNVPGGGFLKVLGL